MYLSGNVQDSQYSSYQELKLSIYGKFNSSIPMWVIHILDYFKMCSYKKKFWN
jgi:hypothetical protein